MEKYFLRIYAICTNCTRIIRKLYDEGKFSSLNKLRALSFNEQELNQIVILLRKCLRATNSINILIILLDFTWNEYQ